MLLKKCLIIVSSLIFTLLGADIGFNEKLAQADLLRDAWLFDSSITAYHDLLRNFDENSFEGESKKDYSNKVYLSLGKAYFQNENYHKVIETLKGKVDNADSLLLMAMAYNELKEYKESVLLLQSSADLLKRSDGLYEMAFATFYLNELEEAEKYFKMLLSSEYEGFQFLSRIYLAKINLSTSNIVEANQHLNLLEEILPKSDVLQYELQFLKALTFFEMQDYKQATIAFEKAIPKRLIAEIPWLQEVLYRSGWSYLKQGDDPNTHDQTKLQLFIKAEDIFTKMDENERLYLSLGACYLNQAHILKDEKAYLKADKILSKQEFFLSDEGKTHALLLRAQATCLYRERDHFYRQLTIKKNQSGLFYAKSLYLKGLNDFEEGEELVSLAKIDEANEAFERAAISLNEASLLLRLKDLVLAGLALKYQAQSYAEQKTSESLFKAYSILESITEDEMILQEMAEADEIYYLQALVLLRLKEESQDGQRYNESIERALKTNLNLYPKGKFADLSFNLLAIFYFKDKKFDEATANFLQLLTNYPSSTIAADALFNAALSLENQTQDFEKVKALRKKLYTEYPNSKFADESYFLYFSYQDYIQGDRLAIKHLENFLEMFPKSPFALNAYYLLGMDYKRDRKTIDGKWIRKKNLVEAIDYFTSVETTFDELYKDGLLNSQLSYYLTIRYLAMLERGLANLKIGEESQKAKKEIYLEFAEHVFLQIIKDFKNPERTLVKFMENQEPYPHFQEESSYWLATTYRNAKNESGAKLILSEMLEKYQLSKITRGFFLSKVWYELGLISMNNQDFISSLSCFTHAEDAAKGKILNSEQKLNLWIQKSLCYQGLKQYDAAILILSKVINDDTISSLRVKAMFLRAEMYEQQGRRELGRKQLEATSKKGGEWALKAKAKLESDYGY